MQKKKTTKKNPKPCWVKASKRLSHSLKPYFYFRTHPHTDRMMGNGRQNQVLGTSSRLRYKKKKKKRAQQSSSIRRAVEITRGRQAYMATCYVRKPRKIWEAVEARPELFPYLGNSRQLALVLLKYTQQTWPLGAIDVVLVSNSQHSKWDL